MSNITIKAVFIGKDGSCGFHTNRQYTLILTHAIGGQIRITDMFSPSLCEYDTVIGLMNNWDAIRWAKSDISIKSPHHEMGTL